MKTIVITGAAGGLGSQLVVKYLQQNNMVVCIDNDDVDMKKLQAIVGTNKNAVFITADIANYEDLKKQLAPFKSVDVLINAAAILTPVGPFAKNDMAEWQRSVNVILMGTVHTCSILLERLLHSKKGKIVNFGGGGAAYARHDHSAYAAAKTAVIRFTETIAAEYPALDINVIAPGAHLTIIWKHETDPHPKKWADPARFIELVTYLTSDKSDGVTGKFLHIYDDWDTKDYRKHAADLYTLRRIDPQLIEKNSQK